MSGPKVLFCNTVELVVNDLHDFKKLSNTYNYMIETSEILNALKEFQYSRVRDDAAPICMGVASLISIG